VNLSPHFTLEEATFSQTAARKGITNMPDDDTVKNMKIAADKMEEVRATLGVPVHVNSWYRSPELNAAVGGSTKSAHTTGFAIDFIAPQYGSPQDVCKAIVKAGIGFDQIIFEGTWVHISFAPTQRNKVLTAHFGAGKTTYTEGLPA
jgi:hypothetical protein